MLVLISIVVTIPAEATGAQITVAIVDDTIPELAETLRIVLTSVELLDSSDDATSPPSLGTNTGMDIFIPASDDPFGMVSISQETYTVAEGDPATISLLRMGGNLAIVTVNYATREGRARAPDDFVEMTGSVVFAAEQTRIDISIPTVDDAIPEVVEDFQFNLLGVTGGVLGNITSATVLIGASDSPFGVIGFQASVVSAGVSIPNPIAIPATVALTVERMGGRRASTDIRWSLVGPGDSEVPFSDFAANSISGVLSMADGQG